MLQGLPANVVAKKIELRYICVCWFCRCPNWFFVPEKLAFCTTGKTVLFIRLIKYWTADIVCAQWETFAIRSQSRKIGFMLCSQIRFVVQGCRINLEDAARFSVATLCDRCLSLRIIGILTLLACSHEFYWRCWMSLCRVCTVLIDWRILGLCPPSVIIFVAAFQYETLKIGRMLCPKSRWCRCILFEVRL